MKKEYETMYRLRLKLYRDLGFTPLPPDPKDNGKFKKFLVRASRSLCIQSISPGIYTEIWEMLAQAPRIQRKRGSWNWIRTFKISNGVISYGGSLMVELLPGV